MANKTFKSIQRWVRRLLSAPFEALPPEYGDTVPPDLRAFEAEAENAQRTVREEAAPASARSRDTKPARQDESLERE